MRPFCVYEDTFQVRESGKRRKVLPTLHSSGWGSLLAFAEEREYLKSNIPIALYCSFALHHTPVYFTHVFTPSFGQNPSADLTLFCFQLSSLQPNDINRARREPLHEHRFRSQLELPDKFFVAVVWCFYTCRIDSCSFGPLRGKVRPVIFLYQLKMLVTSRLQCVYL